MIRRLLALLAGFLPATRSQPMPGHVTAFASAWRTAMRSRCPNAARYVGYPTPAELAIAARMLASHGRRNAYAVLEWAMEDGGVWYELDTMEHFAAKFSDLDALRRARELAALEVV